MKQVEGEIRGKVFLKGNLLFLEVEGDFPPSKPGQFAMISPSPSFDPFLRRPFGILFQDGNSLFFLIKIIGRGTRLISEKRIGEKISVITPLGNGFTLKEGKVLLAGGGTGIVPLIYLASKLKGFTLLYGAKTRDEILIDQFLWLKAMPREIIITTEDGSAGKKGLLTQHIPQEDFSYAYVSGPWPMMREFARLYKGEAEFSLETIMGCGFGVCYGCAVRVRRKGREKIVRACMEGPVFRKEEVIWTQR